MRLFWLLSDSVERIRAQKDMRELTIAMAATAGEAAKTHREGLILEVGTIVKQDVIANAEKLDRAGLEELRALSKMMTMK